MPEPQNDYDPALKKAMAEIKTILTKFDVGAAITLASKTHSEFNYHFPTWSVVQFFGQSGVRIKCKEDDFGSAKAQQEALAVSCHVILQIRDIAAQTFLAMTHIEKQIAAFVDIEHKPYQGFRPHQEGDEL